MGVICFVCGAMFGGLVGTVTMCLVQMGNKIKKTCQIKTSPLE